MISTIIEFISEIYDYQTAGCFLFEPPVRDFVNFIKFLALILVLAVGLLIACFGLAVLFIVCCYAYYKCSARAQPTTLISTNFMAEVSAIRDVRRVRRLLAEEPVAANRENDLGIFPLIFACEFSCPKVVQILLNAGADVNVHSPVNGLTPLMCVARRTQDIDFQIRHYLGYGNDTRGIERFKEDCIDITKLLLQHGANVNTTLTFGLFVEKNALSMTGPVIEIQDLLIEAGARLPRTDIFKRARPFKKF